MTTLITGAAGYIGSHMAYGLADAAGPSVLLDDLSAGICPSLPANTRLFVGNCGDPDLVTALIGAFKVDSIIHFAGSIQVPESIRDPIRYYHNNTINTFKLIEAAIKAHVTNFIFSSTAAVYGAVACPRVSEYAATAPLSPYGKSKLLVEMMLADISRATDLRYVVLRYFNVAGADPQMRTGLSTPNATHLIKVAMEAALGARPYLPVYGTDYPTADGTCVRDYIHVSDLTQAHLSALRYLREGRESVTLNCGYGDGYSVLQVIEAVKRVSGRDFEVRLTERRAGDSAEVVANPARIKSLLNWVPRYNDLDTIVSHGLAWEIEVQRKSAG